MKANIFLTCCLVALGSVATAADSPQQKPQRKTMGGIYPGNQIPEGFTKVGNTDF